jgi:hypothetical protein
MTPSDDAELFHRLLDLYAEADALFAGWECPGRATCCQFGLTGRQPQVWPVEWRLLERALRANPPPRRAESRPDDCPAFDPQTRRCLAYDARPFGCRTHFCEEVREVGPNPRKEIRALARRLADLAEEREPGARLTPLLSTLSAKRRSRPGS